ncbi:MAG: hypothetical protein CSB46_10845 [Micrococcales bacterium]|nr:MAG: hypothetical protein CSB46_10845 [Micrococcales bacterium]
MAIAADRAREDAYPEHWEADVVLRDGGTAHLRPIHPEDSDQLQEFHLAQSPESVYMRFFAPVPRLSVRDLHRFTHVDHRDRVAFVITVAGRIIGIGRYDRLNETEAEVAFNISDDHQGRGVGSVLLEHLAAAARENGINRFVAEVLPQNRKMVSVFKETGYEIRRSFKDGVIALEFDIDPTEKSLAVAVAREHRSEANSLRELLHAGSVVVIGAGQDETSAGSRILHNVLAGGFTGQVYAIHPELDQVQGVPAYPSLADLPQPVRLALVAVDPETIEGDVAQCAAAGVRGIIIFTSGHAELDEEGQRLQSELVTEARRAGLRLIGPNAMGLASLASSSPLNATLSPQLPPPGGLGLFTQSAGLGVAALSSATRRGIGVSSFLNAGNRADVSSNDMMQYWLEDEATTAAALNLESVGNPRKFSPPSRPSYSAPAPWSETTAARRTCTRPPTPSTPCCNKPASFTSRTVTRCSTCPSWSPASRCPPVPGSASSTTPRPSATSSPTRLTAQACRSSGSR